MRKLLFMTSALFLGVSFNVRAEMKTFSGQDVKQTLFNGKRSQTLLTDACTTTGDCSDESRLKIADIFCGTKGFDKADDYTIADYKPGFHKKRTGDRSKLFHGFSFSSCELQESKRRKNLSCAWTIKNFTNTESASYFSSFTCMDGSDHEGL